MTMASGASSMLTARDVYKRQLYDLAAMVGSVFQNPKSQFFLLAVVPVLENIRHALIDLGGFLVGCLLYTSIFPCPR